MLERGLKSIAKGLEDMRRGRVKGGYKLVARVADTPATDKRVREVEQEEVDQVKIQAKRRRENVRSSEMGSALNLYLEKEIGVHVDYAVAQAWECLTRDG